MNLGATRSVVWSIPPEDGAKEIEEYRFTFGSCTMAGSGRYWACLRDFNVWYEEQNGKKLEDALKSKDSEERVEAARLQNLANNYGAVMASLRKVEQRTRALDDKTVAGEWSEIEKPTDWNTFSGFYDAVPWSAAQPLCDAAHACNPGLWLYQDSDAAKKNGGANGG
jgi:hypothetical protein